MIILPAIDICQGKAVRLRRGDYNDMTVYSDDPAQIAEEFKSQGAEYVHIVDLDGAKSGKTDNFETVKRILSVSGLKTEIGGGIRSLETIEKYLISGASRVILGTAAVKDEKLLCKAIEIYGNRIAVGADVKDGSIALNGWLESSGIPLLEFGRRICDIGVKTVICTDVSRDGELRGANLELYRQLVKEFDIEIIASGGVATIDDIIQLLLSNVSGAIIGKAYYEGKISLTDAIAVAKGQ